MILLNAEMGKCVVRCANCHRKKTSTERNDYRNRFVLESQKKEEYFSRCVGSEIGGCFTVTDSREGTLDSPADRKNEVDFEDPFRSRVLARSA